MASAIIHISVAKQINNILEKEEKQILFGTIAPDLNKQVNEEWDLSHFITDGSDLPNIEYFLENYANDLTKDFTLGYLIHLLVDFYWRREFIKNLRVGDSVKLLDGSLIDKKDAIYQNLLYQDYTSVNIPLIDHYKLNLSLFYEDIPVISTKIKEVSLAKLKVIIDEMGLLIKNSEIHEPNIFNLEMIIKFVDETTIKVLNDLTKRNLI